MLLYIQCESKVWIGMVKLLMNKDSKIETTRHP